MKYTHNWLHAGNIESALDKYRHKDNINFLEIGAYEGCTTNYLVDNFLQGKNSKITCIDPWIKYSEACVADMGTKFDSYINESSYDLFIDNTKENKERIVVKKGFSKDLLPTLDEKYDFIYIDGDHSEDAVWVDAVESFKLLKENGVIIFDDYQWQAGSARSPKKAVDRFLEEYKDQIKVLGINRQVIIEKI